jgi:nitrite reductase (NADH) small subunit/3-phenylpropionate/trans-cinnamate dioxygenase ferredoxin subunit
MAEFRTVCRLGDLKPGEGKTVVVNDRLIALFRDDAGCHAIDDTCPHMGASLATGTLENGIVTCPWHAWRFRVADGTWADNPRVKIPAFPVRMVGDEVQIELPEPKPRPVPGTAP